MNEKIKTCLFVFICFAIGYGTGVFLYLQRPRTAGELDSRYAIELGRTEEIVGRLEEELGRERELNKQLREHNSRARELAAGLANTAERNVRNLQDAVGLISEIRAKLKVLENFYVNSDSGNSAD